ncbi:uncharacterized protein JCM10292_001808 [Rhodotorula paludigena]|uniref:uncharacterized protein n=1 Tax=Rhodotorula paludigena TaxID=86838 RepID=UPI00317572C2
MPDSKQRTVLVSYGLKSYLIGLSSSHHEEASVAIRQIISLNPDQSFHLERWVGTRWVYIAPSAWCDEPAMDSLSSTLEYNVVLDGARTAVGTVARSSGSEPAVSDAVLLYAHAEAPEIDAFREKLTDARHDEIISTFEATGLQPEVIAGLTTFGKIVRGFERPSLLQQRILKPLVEGKSLFIVSEATVEHLASFVAGTVDKMHNATPYIVIFVPDRNMAYDVQRMVYMIAGRSGARCLVVSSEPVIPEGFHYVVGTPSDLHKTLKYCNDVSGGGLDLELVCVSQADELYSQGSGADLEAAFEHLSIDQFVLYCSTLEPHVLALYQEYAYKYSYVRCRSEEEQIKLGAHHIIAAEKDKWKMQAIFNLCVSRADVSGIEIICGDEGRAAAILL